MSIHGTHVVVCTSVWARCEQLIAYARRGVQRITANDILVLTTGESSGCEEGGNGNSRSSQQSKADHDRSKKMAYDTEKK